MPTEKIQVGIDGWKNSPTVDTTGSGSLYDESDYTIGQRQGYYTGLAIGLTAAALVLSAFIYIILN